MVVQNLKRCKWRLICHMVVLRRVMLISMRKYKKILCTLSTFAKLKSEFRGLPHIILFFKYDSFVISSASSSNDEKVPAC